MTGREKEIVRHLSEADLNRLLTEIDVGKVSKRLYWIAIWRRDQGFTYCLML